jgi:hypothetical protein
MICFYGVVISPRIAASRIMDPNTCTGKWPKLETRQSLPVHPGDTITSDHAVKIGGHRAYVDITDTWTVNDAETNPTWTERLSSHPHSRPRAPRMVTKSGACDKHGARDACQLTHDVDLAS